MKKKRIIGIVGIVLIVVAVVGIWLWSTVIKQELLYDDILVTVGEIKEGTVVTDEMIQLQRIEKTAIIAGALAQRQSVVGQVTSSYIPSGAQLHSGYFDREPVILQEGEYVFPVPTTWLYSFPQTLRRGDVVSFYAAPAEDGEGNIPSAGQAILSKIKVAYVKDSSNREIVDVTPERIDGSASVATVEVVITEAQANVLMQSYTAQKQFILMYQ